MTRPVALWSTPRSVSTAFDKMMRSRGDHVVFTEPFSVPYYFGEDRVSDRYAPDAIEPVTYRDVLEEVLAASADEPVFVKEMPHHLGPHLDAETVNGFTSSFLIRDPAWSVPSFLAKWPDVTDEELGYEAQRRAFELAWSDGEPPPVIDADDLRADPETVIEAWCDAVGVEHRPDTLSWEPGMPEGWERWADWFERAAESDGFLPPDDRLPPPVDPAVAARIEACRAHYEVLREHRLEI